MQAAAVVIVGTSPEQIFLRNPKSESLSSALHHHWRLGVSASGLKPGDSGCLFYSASGGLTCVTFLVSCGPVRRIF